MARRYYNGTTALKLLSFLRTPKTSNTSTYNSVHCVTERRCLKWVDTNRSVVGLLGNANLGTPANPRSRSGLDWIGSASIYDSVDPSSSHQVGRRF
jgi:hypothetical protein